MSVLRSSCCFHVHGQVLEGQHACKGPSKTEEYNTQGTTRSSQEENTELPKKPQAHAAIPHASRETPRSSAQLSAMRPSSVPHPGFISRKFRRCAPEWHNENISGMMYLFGLAVFLGADAA